MNFQNISGPERFGKGIMAQVRRVLSSPMGTKFATKVCYRCVLRVDGKMEGKDETCQKPEWKGGDAFMDNSYLKLQDCLSVRLLAQ